MNREKTNKNASRVLFLLYAVILIAEMVFAAYGSSHNSLELLTVSFPQAVLVLLFMDIPVFVFLAVIVNAVKEILLYSNSCNKDKKRLTAIFCSFALTILTVILFALTSNLTDPTLNAVFYYSTLISAAATVLSLAVYVKCH